jgi:cbb3-type cytochrome oxidase subunit 1
MPRLSRWFIRAALIYLLLGFTLGGLMLANKGVLLHPLMMTLLPAHIDFVLFGWTVQLIFGMAFWILPRFAQPPLRGNERLAWASFAALNLGIGLLSLSTLFNIETAWLPLVARLCEVAAVSLFAAHAWPRIKIV